MVLFSIVIPVYKVEKYIDKCIKSLLAQTFNDFEAIFIDDCGNDGSMDIVQKYADKDSRFQIIIHSKNKGTGISRNDGIDVANGKYISFLDPDDWLEPDYFETIKQTFDKNPQINWALFKYKENYDKKLDEIRYSLPPKYFTYTHTIDKITPK